MLFSTEEGEGQNLKFDRRMRFEVNFVTAFKLGLKTTMRTLPDGETRNSAVADKPRAAPLVLFIYLL